MSFENSPTHRDGYKIGIKWAICHAAPEQLQRLAILRQRLNASRIISWRGFFSKNGNCGYTRAELVAFEVLGTDAGFQRSDASRFWEDVLGEHSSRANELPFLKGFTEGAIEQVDRS